MQFDVSLIIFFYYIIKSIKLNFIIKIKLDLDKRKIRSMKSFLILLVLLVLLTKVYSIKAMLFCYLPAVQNTKLNRS